MRFIRRFLLSLALLIALAALIVAAAFIPAVQTRIAQRQLELHPELRASLGSLAAGVGALEAHDLNLEINGTLLTLPTLEAQLPLLTAVWDRNLQIRRLVAKGWTLDLNGPLETKAASTAAPPASSPAQAQVVGSSALPSNASTPAIAALKAALIFHEILTGWTLPRDVSFDEVDLEGDVLLPTPRGTNPIAVQVSVKGGGIGAGREGKFEVKVTFPLVDHAGHLIAMLTPHGRLIVALDAARRPTRLDLNVELSAKNHALPEGLSVYATLTAAKATHDETYTVGLRRGERHVAAIVARFPATTRQLAGTWKIDARDSDLAPFFSNRTLPTFASIGGGDFEADDAFTRIRATGQLSTTASQLEAFAAPLERLGTVTLRTDFDVTHRAQTLRVDRLNASLGGARPAVVVRSLQPFSLDEQTGGLHVADPRADWLEGSLPGLPLAWIFGSPAGPALRGADATGNFMVHASDGEFTLSSKAPLTASGVVLQHGEKVFADGLELSLSLRAGISGQSWQLQGSPLTISRAGRRMATIDATASQLIDGDQPIKVAGTWNADLLAWAVFGNRTGRSASGEFTALVGPGLSMENKFSVVGRGPNRALTASLRVKADANGRYTFYGPIKLTLGKSASEISVEGRWARPAAGGRTVLHLTSNQLTLEHLAVLAAPFAAPGSLAPATQPDGRDRIPFWGDWVGRVSFDFARLTAWGHNFAEVGGTFFIDGGAIKLEGGRGVIHQDRHVRAEGAVTFAAAAESPYAAQATATVDEIDAAVLFGPPPRGREPLLHGRFAIAGTLHGNGLNLPDLARRTREEFRVTSNGGSTRLLQTSVASSLTEAPTPVADALGTVGAVFGALLKTKSNILQAEKNPVSKNTEAVLNFTYLTELIRYDQITLTAIRGSDGSLQLADVTIAGPDERLTGSGQLTAVPGQPMAVWPLSLALHLGFHGPAAGFLTEAGLLSAPKDTQGFTQLRQSIHFGGTMAQPDSSEWHDLLVKAAAPPKTAHDKKSN